MAQIVVTDQEVLVQLNLAERIGSLHGNLRLPRGAIRRVEIIDHPFGALHGIRAPGTGFPGVIALGTWRSRGRREFVAVYSGRRAIALELVEGRYQRVLIGVADPEGVRDLLQR